MPLIPHMRSFHPCSRNSAPRSKIEVKAAIVLQHAVQAEGFDSPLSSLCAHVVNERRVSSQKFQFIGERRGISRSEQPSSAIVFDDFWITANVSSEHGAAAAHGFE